MNRKSQLLSLLAEHYDYRDEPFKLSSDELSHEYLDCRAALSNPGPLALAAGEICSKLDPTVQAVGGPVLGGISLAVATSLVAGNVRSFSVRKEAKAHGTGKLIEGDVHPGDRVAILDDVATSGASTLRVIQACQDFGLVPVQAIVLADRGGVAKIQLSSGLRWAGLRGLPIPSSVLALYQFWDISVVGKARQTALKAHGPQMYGNTKKPYRVHLEHVVRILMEEMQDHYSPEILASGWLHDSLEDTELTLDQLQKQLPEPVCAIVDACTDGEGRNRRERKERPYQLIPRTRNAVVIKVGDRLANVESCLSESNVGLWDMYRKEHETFKKRLESSPADFDMRGMWRRLDGLLTVP